MIPLKFGYANLDLGLFQTFQEKLDAAIAHIEINTVFCKLKDGQIPEMSFFDHYEIIEILVPGGNPPYIQSILKKALKQLSDSIDDYVANYEDYFSIRITLERIKDKCIFLSKKNDIHKSFPYEVNEIKYLTIHDGHRYRLFFEQLRFIQLIREQLIDHYSIRKEFFEELTEMIDKKLAGHLEIPAFPRKPYKWQSKNPHLEIAELLLALSNTRIKIKDGEKGSQSKLAKEFYNLFGLDDGLYHQKLQQVRNRKGNQSWLHELPDFINSVKKKNEDSKNEP